MSWSVNGVEALKWLVARLWPSSPEHVYFAFKIMLASTVFLVVVVASISGEQFSATEKPQPPSALGALPTLNPQAPRAQKSKELKKSLREAIKDLPESSFPYFITVDEHD